MGLSLTNQSASAPSATTVCLLNLHKGAGLRTVSSAGLNHRQHFSTNEHCVCIIRARTKVRIFYTNDFLIKVYYKDV